MLSSGGYTGETGLHVPLSYSEISPVLPESLSSETLGTTVIPVFGSHAPSQAMGNGKNVRRAASQRNAALLSLEGSLARVMTDKQLSGQLQAWKVVINFANQYVVLIRSFKAPHEFVSICCRKDHQDLKA